MVAVKDFRFAMALSSVVRSEAESVILLLEVPVAQVLPARER